MNSERAIAHGAAALLLAILLLLFPALWMLQLSFRADGEHFRSEPRPHPTLGNYQALWFATVASSEPCSHTLSPLSHNLGLRALISAIASGGELVMHDLPRVALGPRAGASPRTKPITRTRPSTG
jgi:ABC-type glycerol-3-phosphate transport system permease component